MKQSPIQQINAYRNWTQGRIASVKGAIYIIEQDLRMRKLLSTNCSIAIQNIKNNIINLQTALDSAAAIAMYTERQKKLQNLEKK